MGSPVEETLRLRLQRVLPASREDVYAACTEPERLAEWWGPSGFTAPDVELDVRPGGRYRIAMRPPEGELFQLSGEFREVDPSRRLVYTFVWEPPDPDDRETLVTLTLAEADGATTLVMEQGVFATEARYELHRAGWSEALERLEQVLATRRRG